MNVQVAKKPLAEALQTVERIVPNRSANPGVNLVHVGALGDGLRFSGTSLDIDIETTVAADVRGDGALALPAHVLGQVVRALPADVVSIDVEGSEMAISSGSFSTRLQIVDPSSAPKVSFPSEYRSTLSAGAFVKALDHVRYAAAVADYQAIFRGVKLEFHDGTGRAVATDGFRLAYRDFGDAGGLTGEMIVPARSVEEIVKAFGGSNVDVEPGEGRLSLQREGVRLNVKLMDGAFPDYRRVVPQTFPVQITLAADELRDAVARVAVMADKTANNRVDLFVKEGTLQITAEGSYGRSQESIDVRQEGSESEIALAYNAKYLMDALSPLQDQLRASFSGSTSPSVLEDPADAAYLAMVVPLRTG